MKKRTSALIFGIFLVLLCLSACASKEAGNPAAPAVGAAAETENPDVEKEETEVDDANRTVIAKALGVEEGARNIRFILKSLNAIGAGGIQSAELTNEGGDKAINLVSEGGARYRVYLSGSGSVDGVQSLDTGEWLIKSER